MFLEYKERFLKYGEYCAQLPKATQLLETLVTKVVTIQYLTSPNLVVLQEDHIAEEVARCEKTAGKFKLVDLLTVPMQRILKYHMLLQRLVQQTPVLHEEYHSIQQAYEAMLDVSEFINEVKRDSEQLDLIRAIQVQCPVLSLLLH